MWNFERGCQYKKEVLNIFKGELILNRGREKKNEEERRERNSLEKRREKENFKGKFKESFDKEERKSKLEEGILFLAKEHLINCEFEIDDCLMIDREIFFMLV